jgi:hypothetical protein
VQFVAHIIDRIADFSAVYNDCLSQFRAKHKLRSRSHPVPDLEIASPEFETPFWIWSHADPIRRRLYVRRFEGRLELHDRHQFRSVIGSAAALVDQLKQLGQRGIALRPRALMTTMFARVFLSDWFVHGIGGAVYDEVTDEMVRRFFEIEPPPFLTATATLQLPIESPDVMPTDLGQLKNQMRSLEFHPETHVAEGREGISELVSAKKAWIDQTGRGADLRARHQAIGEINRQLAALLTGQADELKRQYERLVADLRRASLLKSREYSFVLFPPALIDELQAMAARCGLAK